ncbi:MAG: hypothetical protein ACJ8AW_45840 [Rhodopila sp.]
MWWPYDRPERSHHVPHSTYPFIEPNAGNAAAQALPASTVATGRTSDPATSQTDFIDIDADRFATRVDFHIKLLAQDADLALDRPDANSVVPSDPAIQAPRCVP